MAGQPASAKKWQPHYPWWPSRQIDYFYRRKHFLGRVGEIKALIQEVAQTQLADLVFIVGVGRSGTSLLQSMFAAHPDASCLAETAFLRRYVVNAVLQSKYESHGLDAVIDHLKSDALFARTGIDVLEVVQGLSSSECQTDVVIYRKLIQAAKKESTKFVVDKDPRMIEFLPVLKAVAPCAGVVHIIRDPRDVLASKKRAEWSKSGHPWKHIFANQIQLRAGIDHGFAEFGLRYQEITYENLISNPEQHLSILCERLGLRYDAAMLNFPAAAKRLVTENELSWKKETLGPLLCANQGKWTTSLEVRESRLTEVVCSEAMRIGGYVVVEPRDKLGPADLVWMWMGRLCIRVFSPLYRAYRTNKVKGACKRIS